MLRQSLHQKLLQKLSPQQIQLMKLIQLPTQAFEQRLTQELEENPALESGKENVDEIADMPSDDNYEDGGTDSINTEDINIDEYLSDDEIPAYKTHVNNYSPDDEEKQIPFASGTSFTQHLKSQMHTYRLTEEEEIITDFLVGSIDDSGYLRRELIDVLDDLAFTQNIFSTVEEIERLLKIVQQLDPAGVGARDLKECLLIQLKGKKEKTSRILAIKILESSFEHFVKKHYTKLLQKFHVSEDELKDAIRQIEKLNPKPGEGNIEVEETNQITPEFSIEKVEDNFIVSLNDRSVPSVTINQTYLEMLNTNKRKRKINPRQKDAHKFLREKFDLTQIIKKGYSFVVVDSIKTDEKFTTLPINILQSNSEYKNKFGLNKSANFILKQSDEITFVCVNGF